MTKAKILTRKPHACEPDRMSPASSPVVLGARPSVTSPVELIGKTRVCRPPHLVPNLRRQLPRSISTIMLGNEAITFHFLARSRLSIQRARVDATYNTKNADIFAIYYKVFFITRSMLHMKRKTFIHKPTLSPVRPEIVLVERLKKSWIRCLWLRWINRGAA